MTDRTWIKLHNGLTNDPKHRKEMGVRIWLFAWLVDHADWETGIVWEFTDKECAKEMSSSEVTVSVRTIEDQRQELDKSGYIICHPGDQCQHIRIMRWRNPRMTNPPQINVPGNRDTWYDIRRTPPRSKLRTPTILDSHKDSHGDERSEVMIAYEKNIGPITPIIAEHLTDLEKESTTQQVVEAIKRAALNNAHSFAYVKAVWEGQRKNGNGNKQAAKEPTPNKVIR